MADWVKIRSWHAVDGKRILGVSKTHCGRYAVGAPRDKLPNGEKSCESCLRVVAWIAEQYPEIR